MIREQSVCVTSDQETVCKCDRYIKEQSLCVTGDQEIVSVGSILVIFNIKTEE